MDEIDRAQGLQLERMEALEARVRAGRYSGPTPVSRACLWCGDEIGARRLAAVPQARCCVPCQSVIERGGRR